MPLFVPAGGSVPDLLVKLHELDLSPGRTPRGDDPEAAAP